MRKQYPGHAKRVMFGIWSFLRQFMYTKFIIVVDDDIDVRDWKEVIWAITTRVDPARDTLIAENTPIDYLDFASPVSGLGSKMGLDATNKWPGETTRNWGTPIAMDAAVKQRVDELLGVRSGSSMPNRLAHETSPYLQQHADNPVDWYPWGEEALAARAGREQADPAVGRLLGLPLVPRDGARVLRGSAVAAVMNALFVNIKVDREERPDLDQIYQTAHQMLTQRCRRLAAHHVPGAGPETVLRRHLLSRRLRATACRDSASCWSMCAQVTASRAQRNRCAERGAGRDARADAAAAAASQSDSLDPAPIACRAGPAEGDVRSQCTAASAARRNSRIPSELELCLREGTLRGDAQAQRVTLSRWRRWRRAASTTSSAAASAATAWISTG